MNDASFYSNERNAVEAAITEFRLKMERHGIRIGSMKLVDGSSTRGFKALFSRTLHLLSVNHGGTRPDPLHGCTPREGYVGTVLSIDFLEGE